MKIETPILRRLGPIPFWRGSERCLDGLERIYRKAIVAADERLGIDPKASVRSRNADRRKCTSPDTSRRPARPSADSRS